MRCWFFVWVDVGSVHPSSVESWTAQRHVERSCGRLLLLSVQTKGHRRPRVEKIKGGKAEKRTKAPQCKRKKTGKKGESDQEARGQSLSQRDEGGLKMRRALKTGEELRGCLAD